jgi:hypothetical protein
VKDIKIKNAIEIINNMRKDMVLYRDHECSFEYCSPINASGIQELVKNIGSLNIKQWYDDDTFVCKYGCVHICNNICWNANGNGPCCITKRQDPLVLSQFRKSGDVVEVYDNANSFATSEHATSSSNYHRSYEEKIKQDAKWNRRINTVNQTDSIPTSINNKPNTKAKKKKNVKSSRSLKSRASTLGRGNKHSTKGIKKTTLTKKQTNIDTLQNGYPSFVLLDDTKWYIHV